ncbi:pyruvate oxidase [Paenibacillus sp. UNCCL117]|uniref:thiamine pyrophosphate-binding protein n=1 Tax=unclassified Paenibacillus TaxID=185978 RepID=UPI0008885A3E|nr:MULTISPECIES: thiamine pyrophosphate-binding protein [unclassified Paenibacillus]SDD49266.1 pyruvate oxidase [Paenibacillus sp. cl123]SFW50024.1 pyruvate oxidase [Paenibacillus sp. UNCCL117]
MTLFTEVSRDIQLQEEAAAQTVADVMIEQLRLWGVKRIYGVIGDAIFGFMEGLSRQHELEWIGVKHESVAAMMASAEAKLTGRIAVCAAQMGPGLTNLMTGLGDAYLDGVPVLAITGQAPLRKIGTAYKQYINQQELVQAITGFSRIVVHPDAVVDTVAQALFTAVGQSAPVHLSIPSDLWTLPCGAKPHEAIRIAKPAAEPSEIRQAASLMLNAQRPVILAGNRARLAGEAIGHLADRWGCGIIMGYGAKGIIADSSPYLLGGLGEGGNPLASDLCKQADVVLAVGTSWWPDRHVPEHAQVIHIEERISEIGKAVPSQIGIVGSIAETVRTLTDCMENYCPPRNWLQAVNQCKQAWNDQNSRERAISASPLHPASIVSVMEQTMDNDAIIALDEGDVTLWFLRNFKGTAQQLVLSERWRTMGFGLPAAMAAKCSYPNRQVVCVTGDGGLGMVQADLITAARYGLPVTVIVFNNGALQMEQDKLTMKHRRPFETDISNPNFVQIAEASGWAAKRAETNDELRIALDEAKSATKPYLIDVPAAKVTHPDFQIQHEGSMHP